MKNNNHNLTEPVDRQEYKKKYLIRKQLEAEAEEEIRTFEKPINKLKCPKHNTWMRKGKCEQCLMEADKRRQTTEKLGGSSKMKVKVIKL